MSICSFIFIFTLILSQRMIIFFIISGWLWTYTSEYQSCNCWNYYTELGLCSRTIMESLSQLPYFLCIQIAHCHAHWLLLHSHSWNPFRFFSVTTCRVPQSFSVLMPRDLVVSLTPLTTCSWAHFLILPCSPQPLSPLQPASPVFAKGLSWILHALGGFIHFS